MTMPPSHIPLLIAVVHITSHTSTDVEALVRSNLGPLLGDNDYVRCTGTGKDVTCDVYAPWHSACACCKQLKETFSLDGASDVPIENYYYPASMPPPPPSTTVEVDCELPKRYRGCDV